MKSVLMLKHSLVGKLVLFFILVAVLPMLVASQIATNLVSDIVNKNLERWLREAAGYMHFSIRETTQEMKSVCTLMSERFAGANIDFTPEELRAFSDLGADGLWLADARGALLYTSVPKAVRGELLFPDGPFRWITLSGGSRLPVLTETCPIQGKQGDMRTLELGNWFGIDPLEETPSAPIALRIFVPEGDTFQQVYSSDPTTRYHLPTKALNALKNGAQEYFIPKKDWTDDPPGAHSLLTVLRSPDEALLAVFVTSATLLPFNGWLADPSVLFCIFFLVGTLLSGGVGYVLARRLVTPLRQLNNGVRRIAAGDLETEVPVNGNDEIAELASGFNLMTKQLQIMRHDSMQSARQERSRMLGEIALGFAHEIRNPLVVIKTSAEVVLSSLQTQPKESRLLGFVVEEVARINKLISEFLSFAKSSPLQLECFALTSLVQETIELSSAELASRNIECSVKNDMANEKTLGDRSQIRQVLLNLFLNAMDAMPNGGRLIVRLYTENNRPCLQISDTGTGISAETLPTIHLPFISTKKNGLGLGLSKVYAIVEAHGGSISCTSTPGTGTTFTLCLTR